MNAPTHRRGRVVDDKVFAAVIDEIEASGTLQIRVDRVAERAQVNKTTVYRRYPSRDELVLAALLAQADSAIELPDTGDLRRDLVALVETVRDAVTSPLGRALLSATAQSTELAGLRPAYWDARLSAAAAIFDRAVERGECDAPEQPELLLELMVAPIHFRASQVGYELTDSFLEIQVDRLLTDLGPAA